MLKNSFFPYFLLCRFFFSNCVDPVEPEFEFREADLYRANIPARYGWRITLVLDSKVKNPYVYKFKLSGGIGLVSSRLTLEIPIIKDKLMMAVGGRAGLTDSLLPLVSERLKNVHAKFYDGTLKLLYLLERTIKLRSRFTMSVEEEIPLIYTMPKGKLV